MWRNRISTRLAMLLLAVVAVLAVATGVLLWRALAAFVLLRTGTDIDPGLDTLGGALSGGGTVDQAAAAAILRSTLVNLIVVVFVTLLAATAFSRSLLAEPIARLTSATRALAAGDRTVRIRLEDSSELGELARSFDSMADALQSAQDRLEARVASRTAELRALLELSNTVAITVDLQPQLEAVLARLVETTGAVAAEVLELEPTGRLLSAARFGEVPERSLTLGGANEGTSDAEAIREGEDRYGASTIAPSAVIVGDALALPLRARDEVVGVLHAYAAQSSGWDEESLRLAVGLAAQAAVAMENARLYERAKEQAADEERRHLARELHDSVSQAIYAVVLTSHAVRKRLVTDPEGSASAIDSVIELAEGALAEMRALIFELRPEALADVGLVGALDRQLDGLELRHSFTTVRDLGPEPEIAFAAKQVLLRVVQEALHNVAKHAHAHTVRVSMQHDDEALTITVADDGVGFDADRTYPGHLGLTSMHERVGELGGRLNVDSRPGGGTVVSLRLPLGSQAHPATKDTA
ncbi:MAG TPA: histidine kinase [Trueperaceae bacterium]|nr:histidine kinase [Trueperaceae bacterium]